jgi:hypothetical protein
MILLTVALVGYLGNWSPSMDGRVICASVRLPFVAAAKALLAEGHAPGTEIAMKHEGSTILAMQGKIGRRLGARGRACDPWKPLAPHTGSQGGDLGRRPFLSLSLAMARHPLTAGATAATRSEGSPRRCEQVVGLPASAG